LVLKERAFLTNYVTPPEMYGYSNAIDSGLANDVAPANPPFDRDQNFNVSLKTADKTSLNFPLGYECLGATYTSSLRNQM
jgi:hypothetical protein